MSFHLILILVNLVKNMELIDKVLADQAIQFDSIKTGIQAHAETYSFNIESKLFNQLTKEQQELWRKELEQACISGGEAGVELARDPRYKENHSEVKEELSVEEKAKRYDEAIKVAKDSFNYPDHQGFIRADVVFPELKESEHEKIRKELIQYLKDYPTNLPSGQYCRDDFFKWLEKQKEQEPTTQPVWSEEDEKLYKLSLENLTELMHRFGEEYCKVGDCINWFESINDRFFKKYK
jgi:hypothetical protein